MTAVHLFFKKPKGTGTPPVHLVFGESTPPPAAGGIKAFNGVAWVTATAKRWNGSAWATTAPKRFDGATWQNL